MHELDQHGVRRPPTVVSVPALWLALRHHQSQNRQTALGPSRMHGRILSGWAHVVTWLAVAQDPQDPRMYGTETGGMGFCWFMAVL